MRALCIALSSLLATAPIAAQVDKPAGSTRRRPRWRSHWSFTKLERPAPPEVKNASWPRSDLDRFVLARLEARGLAPSPPADRATLIRRVSLDLTGLPPSPEEVTAFENDRRPDAYERLVDELLRRPAYGEHWTRLWLDLARYADTKGYEKDLNRDIWAYRDWLIRAFNADMPFDTFTRDQLAGDLLPAPTRDQLIATAFHRNTLNNDEGGTDNEEFRVAAVKDRVDTTVQVWMGLSMGCAKCHDHKYDPITQREYYEFYAFFNQTRDADTYNEAPTIPTPTAAQREALKKLEAELGALREKLAGGAPEKETKAAIAKLEKQKKRLDIDRLPIMRELDPEKRRKTHVQVRGSFLSPGAEVRPGVPAAFGPLPNGAPKNRLGVAMWLTDAANPLTARVTVNRWWAQFFGTGIVETQEDFGTQGARPSHPHLLDWLATEFIRQGWSFKRLCKTIVMSATYRQRSTATPELLRIDRFNRLLARGPAFRLPAETIRDNALAIAGLLSHKMYGPSVMPPQPPGIWQSTYNASKWRTSPGQDRWRRGIYTFTKRTSGYPASLTFDAPTRETCTLRRIRTNTALQALVTLNDPVYVEAAQAMARRLEDEGGESLDERLAYGLRLAVARRPRASELARLRGLYQSRLHHYEAHPEAARAMATDPLGPAPEGTDLAELAALTVVCNVILNLDEVLVKR